MGLISEIALSFKKNVNLVYAAVIIVVIGFISGLFLTIAPDVETSYSVFVLNYFNTVLSPEKSALIFSFKRLIYFALQLLLIALFSLNSISFYFIFVLLLYRGYILGLFAKLFVFGLGFNGVIFYLFLILVQSSLFCLAIIVFMVNVYKAKCKNKNFYIRCLICSFLIALIGVLVEFILLSVLFRPLNFYF